MIEKALAFATQAHSGQKRKGVPLPYILHPMEVATIVAGISTDPDLIAAALLHDTIEDCKDVTYDVILQIFGSRIASFVAAESEDKSKTWMERKQATIDHIATENRLEVKILTLADKLANMRSLERDYQSLGEQIWDCFNQKDPRYIEWYYKGVRDGLTVLNHTLAYKEYDYLIRKLFDHMEDI